MYKHPRCKRCDYLQNLISCLLILAELSIEKNILIRIWNGMFLSNHHSEYSFQPGVDLNIE